MKMQNQWKVNLNLVEATLLLGIKLSLKIAIHQTMKVFIPLLMIHTPMPQLVVLVTKTLCPVKIQLLYQTNFLVLHITQCQIYNFTIHQIFQKHSLPLRLLLHHHHLHHCECHYFLCIPLLLHLDSPLIPHFL